MMVSFYKTCLKKRGTPLPPYKNLELEAVFMHVLKGTFKPYIEKYYTKKISKQMLPCFTPSGTFIEREIESLESYSGVICLDFDKLEHRYETKERITKDSHTFGVFTSPSRNGLKVFVKVDSGPEDHYTAFSQLSEYYKNLSGVFPDRKCKDVSRLCFISSDPFLYVNINSDTFKVDTSIIEETPRARETGQFHYADTAAQYLINFTQKKAGVYQHGNRNDFIFRLACNCNRYGIPKIQAVDICRIPYHTDTKDFPEPEFIKTIDSAYSNTHDFYRFELPRNLL